MAKIDEYLQCIKTVAIAGHVNPDGDCIGSCMGMYLYLCDNFPDIRAAVYLESYREVFSFIKKIDEAKEVCEPEPVDLLILLDISSGSRIGVASPLLDTAGKTLCIDHHVTNTGKYTWFFNEPETSSASEVLYGFLDQEKISADCAAALYTGIINDTGVFQYPSTSPKTMCVAAELMKKGIPFTEIIDGTFFQKSYRQNCILGKVLLESRRMFGGKLILGSVRLSDMAAFQVESKDMEGIVSQLRNTAGAEVAVFLYEQHESFFKVSLRSREHVDVSMAAKTFGGGGHMRAAGCSIEGTMEEAENKIIAELKPYLE